MEMAKKNNAYTCFFCDCVPVINRPVAYDLDKVDPFVARCQRCGVFVVGKDEESAVALWNKLQEWILKEPNAAWVIAMRKYYSGKK